MKALIDKKSVLRKISKKEKKSKLDVLVFQFNSTFQKKARLMLKLDDVHSRKKQILFNKRKL